MEVEKWVVNNHYYTKQGDEFIYLGRKKREKNADKVERLLKKNILSPGKPRKLVEVKG